jgi:hypothetical protein
MSTDFTQEYSMSVHLRMLSAISVLLLGMSTTAATQTVAATEAVRVTLVAGPATARGGRTEVVRYARITPQNVIIVDRNATAEDLGAALALFNALRAGFGDRLESDLRAQPQTFRGGAAWHKSEYRAWLIQQLTRLRASPVVSTPVFGMARAVQITLPAVKAAVVPTQPGTD